MSAVLISFKKRLGRLFLQECELVHETGFTQSQSIGASLGLKLFHSALVLCGEFSRMLISKSHRVRLIMQPSLLVKLPDFIFGIPNKRTIDANSHLTPAGKHGSRPNPSLQKSLFGSHIAEL